MFIIISFIIFSLFYSFNFFLFLYSPQHLSCKYIDEECDEERTDEGFYCREPAAGVTFWFYIIASERGERGDAEEEAEGKVCFSQI